MDRLPPVFRLRLRRGAALLALACCLSPAAPRVEVSARVDRAEATIGDKVRYEITVEHPAGASVELPAVKGNIGRFELLDYRVSKGDSSAPASVTHALEIASYTLGEDTLPPQRVEVRVPGDTAAWVVYTPPTYVRINRLTSANDSGIVDIDETGRLPGTFPWGFVFVALMALALWRYLVWRGKRPPRGSGAAGVPLPPYEAALGKLAALETSLAADWAPERGRGFAFAFSDLLREYLAARYGIDALEATTSELLERAATLPLPADRMEWLREVSAELDTVKFATGTAPREKAARWISDARAFLEATRPVPATPATESNVEAA